MCNEKLQAEILRMFGSAGMNSSDGCLLFNIRVHNFWNTMMHRAEACIKLVDSLTDLKVLSQLYDMDFYPQDIRMYKYSKKDYVNVQQIVGQKVNKAGYAFVNDRTILNQCKGLILWFVLYDEQNVVIQNHMIAIPIEVLLTNDKSGSSIIIDLYFDDTSLYKMEFVTCESICLNDEYHSMGWQKCTYANQRPMKKHVDFHPITIEKVMWNNKNTVTQHLVTAPIVLPSSSMDRLLV